MLPGLGRGGHVKCASAVLGGEGGVMGGGGGGGELKKRSCQIAGGPMSAARQPDRCINHTPALLRVPASPPPTAAPRPPSAPARPAALIPP